MSGETCHLCCEPVDPDEAVWTPDEDDPARLAWCPDLDACLDRSIARLRRAQRRPLAVPVTLGGRAATTA